MRILLILEIYLLYKRYILVKQLSFIIIFVWYNKNKEFYWLNLFGNKQDRDDWFVNIYKKFR